ncbi:hypothetical protein XK07_00085 [Campylobacter lari]|uniref:hypothetical protein n=1 Tax=Campylobacter TaxID=194 RepID=UPI000E11B2FA|nr:MULTISPECIES: hypothetical protein [Campylobacter]EAK9856533.1 hypothetical protein [Campylobacter lari]EGK8009233.1 hypothetical protein [Campylobacter lari]MCV3396702.1 hypothetical protein [Campylobacter sp. RKI_CA19_01116]MCV3433647.1 hypothetical protein [Campylobacter sp. IFREMER_LSEM_CL1846]SUX06038.1 Uncharacterised protein [Campylobacter lari]
MRGNNLNEMIRIYDKYMSIYGDSGVFRLDDDDLLYASEILNKGGFFCYDEKIVDREYDLMCYFAVIFLPKNDLAKHAIKILKTLEKNRVGERMKFWFCDDENYAKIKIISLYMERK